jgi:hypothetical protein
MSRRELPVPQAFQFPVGMFLAVLDATSDAARQLPAYLLRLPMAGLSGAWRLGQAIRPKAKEATESVWPNQQPTPDSAAPVTPPSTPVTPAVAGPDVADVVNPLDLPEEVLAADVPPDAELAADVPPDAELAPDELPLPDYDHMTLGSLRGRLRSLDLVSLVQIRDYERTHANRLPIVSMLDNRILKTTAAAPAPVVGNDGSAL